MTLGNRTVTAGWLNQPGHQLKNYIQSWNFWTIYGGQEPSMHCIGFSYRPVRLHRLAESIPRKSISGLLTASVYNADWGTGTEKELIRGQNDVFCICIVKLKLKKIPVIIGWWKPFLCKDFTGLPIKYE
jgi:hypothetical protein